MAGDLAMLVIVFLALIGPGSGGRGTPEVGDRLPSAEQSRRILKIHNDLRRLQDAADMEYMEWSQSLAEISQDTATKCIFRSGNSGQEQIMSQNMAVLSSTTNITEMTSAVTWWYDDTYDVNTRYCKEPARCNQHLQLIWASTNEVGCAYSICDTLANAETNETSDNVTLFVCTYHLGLSTSGDSPRPFVPGPACSQCRSGADWCDMIEPRGLCRRMYEQTTTTTTTRIQY
ncbi:hypothetical protein LSH36_1011g00014 [Paralvinella palmiformis]|uniref:SCP domain-containing protein n=1 Tax=Paralvinella palmiformis TaxID=53620 RepID=A0AAD9IWR1_9ANNE|nr:hypothetical protein LSH36_1011g00014 [Paralvinella palmiformis]